MSGTDLLGDLEQSLLDAKEERIRTHGKFLGRCSRYMGDDQDAAGRLPGHLYADPDGDLELWEYRLETHSLPAMERAA